MSSFIKALLQSLISSIYPVQKFDAIVFDVFTFPPIIKSFQLYHEDEIVDEDSTSIENQENEEGQNIDQLENFETNIVGLIWVAGFTGNPDEEFNDIKKCKENLTVNFVNPVLLINKIIPKIIPNDNSFIAVLTSVAGIRGRGKKLFYSSAKSGMNAYLSGLRQKVFDKRIFLSLPFFGGIHRFLPALFKGFGYQITFIDVNHRPRINGVSKYGTLDRLFKGIIDIIRVKKIIKNYKENI